MESVSDFGSGGTGPELARMGFRLGTRTGADEA